jgi:peroxiredoxin
MFSPSWQRLAPYLILIGGLVWIFASRADPSQTTASPPVAQAGFRAPDFSLRTAEGEIITLSELKGRPILINFWASWCPPCRAEMPAFERAYQAWQDQGFLILAINATQQDSVDQALAFAQEYGLSFPLLFDADGQVYRNYQVRSLPTSFFVDPQGVIREVVVGGPISEALLHVRVEQLLKSPFLERP